MAVQGNIELASDLTGADELREEAIVVPFVSDTAGDDRRVNL
jgi:hypothetical protein